MKKYQHYIDVQGDILCKEVYCFLRKCDKWADHVANHFAFPLLGKIMILESKSLNLHSSKLRPVIADSSFY